MLQQTRMLPVNPANGVRHWPIPRGDWHSVGLTHQVESGGLYAIRVWAWGQILKPSGFDLSPNDYLTLRFGLFVNGTLVPLSERGMCGSVTNEWTFGQVETEYRLPLAAGDEIEIKFDVFCNPDDRPEVDNISVNCNENGRTGIRVESISE